MEENFPQNNLQPVTPRNNSYNLPIILLSLFILIIAANGIFFVGLKVGEKQSKEKERNAALSKETQDEELGFSLHYPEGWKVLPPTTLSASSEKTITNCNLKETEPTGDQSIREMNNCASFSYKIKTHYGQKPDKNFTFNDWVDQSENGNETNSTKIGQYKAQETDYQKSLNGKTKHKNIYINLGKNWTAKIDMIYAENYPSGYEILNKMLSSLMIVSPSIPKSENNVSQETGNWKTFTNDLLGFTMRYPWSWYLDRENNLIYNSPKINKNMIGDIDEKSDKGKGVVTINLTTNKQADLTLEEYIDGEADDHAKQLGLNCGNKVIRPKIKFKVDGKPAIKTVTPYLKGPFPQTAVYIERTPTEIYSITGGIDYLSYENDFNLMLSTFRFIDQKQPSQTNGGPDENDWTEFNGYLYKKIWVDKMTWDKAEAVCEQENAQLTSINDREEDNFVQQLCGTGNTCRLGHKNTGGYCTKPYESWIDGKPFIYSNWQEGEPGYACGEDCLDMDKTGKWNNEWCGNPYGYQKYAICKKQK